MAEKLNKMIARLENGWTAHALRVDTDGATVTEEA
jgi:hypothetical protein